MRNGLKIGAAVVVLGLGLGLTALGQGSRPLVAISGSQPVNLRPGQISDGNSILVMKQVYETLIEFKPGTTEAAPGLALRWSPSKNSTVWTFTLRPNVRFQDGTPFNAEAVVFNVNSWWDDASPYNTKSSDIVNEIFGGYKSSKNTMIKSVEALGAYTVRFTLNTPNGNFPDIFGTGYFGIASPTAMKAGGKNYGTPAGTAVGTGPFSLKSWQSGDRIVLEKNPTYWHKGLPLSSGIVVRFIKDPSAALAELRAGNADLDATITLPPDAVASVANDKNIKIVARPAFNVGYLALNQGIKPLDNLKVRQAIAAAINRKDIVNSFYGDKGVSNAHLVPPVMSWAYSKNVSDFAYNPEQAKKLLAEAGFPNGFTMDLWYMPVVRPYFPTAKAVAEAMAADLAAVGIKTNLKTEDWGTYLSDAPAGKFASWMLGWTGDYADPVNFFDPIVGESQATALGYKNPQLYQALDAGRNASSRAAAAAAYQKADEMLFRDVPLIPVVHGSPAYAQRANVTGWVLSPLGEESLASVSVK